MDDYRELQRKLTALIKQYREADKGKESLTAEIMELNKQLKDHDSKIGVNYRPIGSYKKQIDG